MALSSLLSLMLALLVLNQGCSAQTTTLDENQRGFQSKCRLESFSALEPTKSFESEGGVTEYWDPNDEQLQCVGVALIRYTIKPRGLLLPFYTNSPRIHYVLKGKGIQETIVAGCPALYRSQSSSAQWFRGKRRSFSDEHQKINAIRQDDVVAVPSSSAQWVYNTGDSDLVFFSLIYTVNGNNQLDPTLREFFLAGNPQEDQEFSNRSKSWSWDWSRGHGRGRWGNLGGNVFSGLAPETVAGSLNVDSEVAKKVQGVEDLRGSIILLEDGLEFLSPEQEEEEQEGGGYGRGYGRGNGIEETICSLSYVHPLGEPRMHADKYNPHGGHLTGLNTPNMPILEYLQLGVDRGVLYKDAILVPHYNLNCHAVIYCTRGSGWIQVVGENGRRVFDGEVKEGQVLIVPQHYVVVKKGGSDAFDWVAIKTSDNPMINALAGELSLIRSMPVAVLMSSYQMQREEAIDLKTRGELTFISPGWSSLIKS